MKPYTKSTEQDFKKEILQSEERHGILSAPLPDAGQQEPPQQQYAPRAATARDFQPLNNRWISLYTEHHNKQLF
ncbi:hypothetical protein CLOSTHATH_04464 [Hungatella hathewayi DSM 13479]|jgi:hypothetical protein|uniref:Uncharacterized protein n=1 Tax=Hungatella hathewayi DSM 13479 TaxID=566550 RepID=D3ALG8_9FIRM|nr:hypothetical protein CLOSTHATH_04464 [Hungatella hathewayi DSM 13479]QRW39748.1 pimelyl-ACP methyl ester esterase [bacterium]